MDFLKEKVLPKDLVLFPGNEFDLLRKEEIIKTLPESFGKNKEHFQYELYYLRQWCIFNDVKVYIDTEEDENGDIFYNYYTKIFNYLIIKELANHDFYNIKKQTLIPIYDKEDGSFIRYEQDYWKINLLAMINDSVFIIDTIYKFELEKLFLVNKLPSSEKYLNIENKILLKFLLSSLSLESIKEINIKSIKVQESDGNIIYTGKDCNNKYFNTNGLLLFKTLEEAITFINKANDYINNSNEETKEEEYINYYNFIYKIREEFYEKIRNSKYTFLTKFKYNEERQFLKINNLSDISYSSIEKVTFKPEFITFLITAVEETSTEEKYVCSITLYSYNSYKALYNYKINSLNSITKKEEILRSPISEEISLHGISGYLVGEISDYKNITPYYEKIIIETNDLFNIIIS